MIVELNRVITTDKASLQKMEIENENLHEKVNKLLESSGTHDDSVLLYQVG